MSQDSPIDLEGLLGDTLSDSSSGGEHNVSEEETLQEDRPRDSVTGRFIPAEENPKLEEGEVEAVLDENFVEHPDSEFLPQVTLDSIIEEEGEAN